MNVAAGLGGKEPSAAGGSCVLLDGLFIFLLADRATLILHQLVFSPPRNEYVRSQRREHRRPSLSMDSMRSHDHGRRNYGTAVEKVLSRVHLRKYDLGIKPQHRAHEADMMATDAGISGYHCYSNGD
jgi:hypothetical protein